MPVHLLLTELQILNATNFAVLCDLRFSPASTEWKIKSQKSVAKILRTVASFVVSDQSKSVKVLFSSKYSWLDRFDGIKKNFIFQVESNVSFFFKGCKRNRFETTISVQHVYSVLCRLNKIKKKIVILKRAKGSLFFSENRNAIFLIILV